MIAAYVRVSTLEQHLHGYSVGEQQERITAYCKSMGWGAPKLFTDAGFTGANLNRPAMQEMIQGIKNGTITRVVVFKLDRLSRSQKDTVELLEDIFIPNNVDFVSMSESFQLTSPFGRAVVGVLSVFAQLERDTIRERVMVGREARAKKGKYHGGKTPPVGYDYKDGCLVVNDFEAMQVRECFELYKTGHTYAEIASELNEKGWGHKYGQWLLQRVRCVLINPIYTGTISFGGVQYKGNHEAIIDEETFETVGAMIARNRKRHTRTGRTSEAFLVGKIFCARCGQRYTHTVSISGHKKNGPRISYYSCTARVRSKQTGYKCDNTIHHAAEIDNIVFNSMRELDFKAVSDYKAAEPDTVKTLRKELAKIDKQRSRLLDLYSLGTFTAEELNAKTEPLTASKNAIEKQLADLSTERRSPADMKKLVSSIGGILDNGDPVSVRHLIDALVDHVEIDGDDITIFWDFD